MRTYLFAAVLGLIACNNSSSEAPKVAASAPAAAVVAGRVLEVSGTVTVAGKPLAKGDSVAADAIVDTGTAGSVVIELAHNLVRWELGPNKKVKVNESVAWKAPKRTEPVADVEHDTISGGRPAERMAAGTTTTEGGAKADTEEDKAAKADTAEPKADAAQRKREAMEAAKESGVIGAFGGDSSGAGDLGLKGTGPGGGGTGGGLGVSGTGKGGGGTGEGTIGLGGIGTIGHGGGTGTGQGYGAGGGKLRGGKDKTPTVRQGTTEVSGQLAPEIIRRVVRQRFNQLRYCYEKSLVSKPDLQGKVVVRFVIDSTGAVTKAEATSSTLGDDTATACIVSVFKKMQFPKPVTGSVNASYPLVFTPGD